MSRIDLPGYGTATTPDCLLEPACSNRQCRADGVEIDEQGYCPACRPREDETCAAWLGRMAGMGFAS